MKRTKRYIFNKETLNYDVVKSPSEFWLYTKSVLPFVLVGVAMFVLMLFVTTFTSGVLMIFGNKFHMIFTFFVCKKYDKVYNVSANNGVNKFY